MYKCLKNFSTQISWSTVHSAIITEGKSHLKNRQVFIEDKKSTPRKCQGASAKQNKWSICHCSVPVKSLWHTSPNISDVLSGSTVFPCSNMYIYGYIYIYIYMHVCIKQTTLKSLGDIESHYLSPLNSSVEALGNRMPHQWQLWSAVVSSQHQ